jgi:hypothetical protein
MKNFELRTGYLHWVRVYSPNTGVGYCGDDEPPTDGECLVVGDRSALILHDTITPEFDEDAASVEDAHCEPGTIWYDPVSRIRVVVLDVENGAVAIAISD